MCRGGGGGVIFSICSLISNTLPQLEQSSLQPSTVLLHRHLLQTTSYNHLLLLHHLLISRKEKTKQQQARNPLSRRVWEARRAFGPSTHYRIVADADADADMQMQMQMQVQMQNFILIVFHQLMLHLWARKMFYFTYKTWLVCLLPVQNLSRVAILRNMGILQINICWRYDYLLGNV